MWMINSGKCWDQKDGWSGVSNQNNCLSLTCHNGYHIKQEDLITIIHTVESQNVTESLALIDVHFDSTVNLTDFGNHFRSVIRLSIFNQVTYDFAVVLRLIPSITHLSFFDVKVLPSALFCGLPRTNVISLDLYGCHFTHDAVEAEWFSQLTHLVDDNEKLPINQIIEYGKLVKLTVEVKRHHGEFVGALLKARSVKDLHILRTNYYGPSGWEEIYRYLKEDCLLESFTRNHPYYDNQELLESIKYHPRLREVDMYSVTPEVDRRLELNQSNKVRRTVELLGHDVLPKDIVRHVYGFIR
jgi:hypothetical protein